MLIISTTHTFSRENADIKQNIIYNSRTRTMLLLSNILLVTFLSYVQLEGSVNGENGCLTLDRHGNCSCCKSGFRGQTCNDICEHCLSRLSMEQSCTYYCKTGYYGKTCDKPCPTTCASGISGPHFCKEKYGLPVCIKCIHGFYGKHCDQICDTNCEQGTCYRTDGKCLNCSSNAFYGDYCRLPCNQGCVSGTCNRTGQCAHGCKFGFYGDRCEFMCGSACKQGRCTRHGHLAYNCTEGCHGGYWGTPCLEKCPNNCMECERQSGRCTLCVENYGQNPRTGECIRERKPAVPQVGDLIIIGIVGVVVIVLSGIIIMVIWKKRRRHVMSDTSAREYGLVTMQNDYNGQLEQKAMLHPLNLPVNEKVQLS